MSNIKFYTEEQVRKAIELAQKCEHECGGVYFDYTETEIIENLTPIELPSDEDINERSYFDKDNDKLIVNAAEIVRFRYGAKWIKEQILNQNK